MTWFKRCCWIAAWSLWLWLGFGVYRELPRSHGPAVCQLPMEPGEIPMGFVPRGDEIVTTLPLGGSGAATITAYNALTGERLREFAGPLPNVSSPGDESQSRALRHHGALFANSSPTIVGKESDWGLHFLDVGTGAWNRVAIGPADWLVASESRPWALFGERHAPGFPERRIVVYDFAKRKELFAMHSPILGRRVASAYFEPATDRLVILTTVESRDVTNVRYMIWTLGEQPRLERTIDTDFAGAWNPSPSATQRVAFERSWHPDPGIFVVDLADGSIVARFPGGKPNDSSPSAIASPPCTLSRDGKTVLAGKPAALWEVDTAKLLWRGNPHEIAVVDAERGEFAVIENWFLRLPTWLQFRSLREHDTVAWRSLQTGKVLWRTWTSEFLSLDSLSVDRTRGVSSKGAVYRTELHVNWLLCAFCEAVLALPLVSLWAMLRWRRRRKSIA